MAVSVGDIVRVKDSAPFHPGKVGPVIKVTGDDGNQIVTVLVDNPFGGSDPVDFHSSQLDVVSKQGLAGAMKAFSMRQPGGAGKSTRKASPPKNKGRNKPKGK